MSNRITSTHPLSIATSIAIESIVVGGNVPYESDRIKPPMVDVKNYNSIWINVTTLYRNYMGALDKMVKENISPSEMASDIIQEMSYLRNLLEEQNLKVVFYFCQYNKLRSKHPNAKLKVDTTQSQIFNHELMLTTLSVITKSTKDLTIFSNEITSDTMDKAMIITHYSIDLLSEKKFNRLDLLESHTGVLKTKALWYTKLHSDKKNASIPFNRFTIQVFGDGQLFSPYGRQAIDAVVELAAKYQWTYLSTNERIFITMTLMKDKMLLEELKGLYLLN